MRVIAEDDSLLFQVSNANIFMPKFSSTDPNFILTNSDYARYAIARVVAGIRNSKTFGTGWKTSKRKFPRDRKSVV